MPGGRDAYRLAASARPFTLCLSCNLPLQAVDKAQIAARLPEQVSRLHDSFVRCPGCDGVVLDSSLAGS
jgi:uncharacterized protein with PIN domain